MFNYEIWKEIGFYNQVRDYQTKQILSEGILENKKKGVYNIKEISFKDVEIKRIIDSIKGGYIIDVNK